ncbi:MULTISPECIES: GDSL-type esterase/lipase family protein [unclassified Streptomyces]|uniref:GDSL-type esterase/lipase family protein n=1 Tax=unclassified Streptomyces TaxID=2593676 RepID=UPI00081E07A9|nr:MULTISPECIES: GDSL-type esterase/lipase family protein [unclassified Streptomyces]MYR96462.1 lipase [Streptomyces sp. SID4937]SCE10112.1 GDSL-like Lipase/Acylhydrolase family protein [Streptomyces sp. ScaeMP-e83]
MDDSPGLITTPLTDDLVRGALDLERTARGGLLPHRLPARARAQFGGDEQVAQAETQPSGVRLVFRTRATAVEVDVQRTVIGYRGVPPRPDGAYDLHIDGEPGGRATASGGDLVTVDLSDGSQETVPGPVGTVRFEGLAGREKTVEIWLPYTEITELIALRTDAPVAAVEPGGRRVWLHHGSSISQGSAADSSATAWPALAAVVGGVELINLSLGGSALLDPYTARALRDTPADLISVKIGINLVNRDLMRLRAFGPAVHGFLDTIREGHPTTPLLVISPILCPVQEETPGPAAPEFSEEEVQFTALGDPSEVALGKLTLRVVREELARIVAERAADDPGLYYLDGLELYGEADFAELPLPDRLHPDAAAHRRMGERFGAYAFGPGGPFSAAP